MNFFFVQNVSLIIIVITIICEAKDNCNYSCLSKTYSFSDVSATFTAKQINGINYLTINLVGDNIKESELQQTSVSISSNYGSNTYYCERTKTGNTKAFISTPTGSVNNGSSMYQYNKLYCSWTMSNSDISWPKYQGGTPFYLEFESDFNIRLANLDQSLNVAESTEELPIYRMKFLKCCNKVYGNDKVQFTVRQTDKSNDFNVFPLIDGTYYLSIMLTESDSSSLGFEVYLSSGRIDGYIKQHGGSAFYFDSQFLYDEVLKGQLGTWSIPLSISDMDDKYDTKNRVYDLQISLDGTNVYTEKGISFNSGSIQIHVSSIFIIFSAFVVHQMVWN